MMICAIASRCESSEETPAARRFKTSRSLALGIAQSLAVPTQRSIADLAADQEMNAKCHYHASSLKKIL